MSRELTSIQWRTSENCVFESLIVQQTCPLSDMHANSKDVTEKYVSFRVSSLRLANCCVISSGDECLSLNFKNSKGSADAQQFPSVRTEPKGSLQTRSWGSAGREVHICWWAEVETCVISLSTTAQTVSDAVLG